MKPNTDKILRDKIESLDTLPENYNGSIGSKWELLRAGMQSPREERFPILRLAASITMVTGLMVWMIYITTRDNGQTSSLNTKTPQKENKQILPQQTPAIELTAKQNIVSPKQITTAPKPEANVPREGRIELPINAQENLPSQPPEQEEKLVENKATPEPVIAEVTVLKNKAGSKPKKRYIGLEFGEAPKNIAQNTHEPKSVPLIIRLLPKKSESSGSTVLATEDNPLRMQVSF